MVRPILRKEGSTAEITSGREEVGSSRKNLLRLQDVSEYTGYREATCEWHGKEGEFEENRYSLGKERM